MKNKRESIRPSDNRYAALMMQTFLAISGLVLLLVVYHLIIFRLEGGNFEHLLRTVRVILAFMHKQKELDSLAGSGHEDHISGGFQTAGPIGIMRA